MAANQSECGPSAAKRRKGRKPEFEQKVTEKTTAALRLGVFA
jgi:hypothetical protein